MGKFFNDKNQLAVFEDYLGDQHKKYRSSLNNKEYESAKTYNFLEYNYYRLKKLAKLLHKKIYNLGSDDFFDLTYDEYHTEIKNKKNIVLDYLCNENELFQKKQEEIYHYFFTRK